MELGIGAGWKRDEWEAYGYGFPSARERLANLGDQLEIIAKMMAPGLATYEGDHGMVRDAINVPKPLQRPGIPIMVGGNGPEVTWRLAARHADELNLDGLTPEELVEALPIIASRCEEIDRDPDDLRVSVHVFATRFTDAGPSRVDLLGRYAELGVSRVIGLVSTCVDTDTALEELAADAAEAGIEMAV